MRSCLRISAFVVVTLFSSTGNLLAQTGEFVATVPGSVVHAGYGLQDWLQELRNGKAELPPSLEAIHDPVIIVPPQPEPAPVKRKKTAKKVTTTSQVQTRQVQTGQQ
jgi:hypothetical protein